MNKLLKGLMLGLVILLPLQGTYALVNPDELDEPIPDWLARIYIGSGTGADESKSLFCYGALIDARWIVSAVGCFNDPYRVLESYSSEQFTRYYVRLGSSSTFYEVRNKYRSPKADLQLYELKAPVTQPAIAIANASGAELLERAVEVLGLDSSAGMGDTFYNPGTSTPSGTCTLNGKTFVDAGTICFVFTYPVRHGKFLSVAAKVIDPQGNNRPTTALDNKVTPITTGERLYLKFNTVTSYSCMEDMGMPITMKNASGVRELVGLVNIVGGAWGLPLCSGSIANRNTAVGYFRDYIEQIKIESQFRAVCPLAPEVSVNRLTLAEVELSWPSVNQADGYTVHYSTEPGVAPIKSLNLGNKTRVKTVLKAGQVIEAAIQAFNTDCTSPLSNRVLLKIAD